MKIFRLFTMLMLGIMLNVNLTSCSKDEIIPDTEQGDNNDGSEIVHPNGIPGNIPNNIIYYITSNNSIIHFSNEDVFGGAKIVSNTYSSTKGYGTIEFASDITAIEANAFLVKSYLTYVALPNSVESIGSNAFYYCFDLTSVTIPNSVTSIGDDAFSGCSGLTSVTIGNSVESIGSNAFSGCSGLTSVTIPNSVKSIGSSAFYDCDGLTSVIIPNSVERIGGSAFYDCDGLTSVTVGNSVKSIGNGTFSYCSSLSSIVVEKRNTVYDSRNNCNAIIKTATNTLHSGCKTTIIPNSVESIGDYAFFGCSGLKLITIGNSIMSIGYSAFYDCI